MVQLLPYVEQKNAYNGLNLRWGVYDPPNATVRRHGVGVFLCPSDRFPGAGGGVAQNSYAACHHDAEAPIDVTNTGSFPLNTPVRYDDVSDGTSFTIFLGEKRTTGGELGWVSGTRATLRNAGTPINGVAPVGPGLGPDDGEDDAPAPSPAGNADETLEVGGFGSRHAGGTNFAFGDGSIRFLKSGISGRVFRRLANRADGDLVSGDKF
jgi:prepilin-type processing-associated H-X9-DG protein